MSDSLTNEYSKALPNLVAKKIDGLSKFMDQ